MQITNNTDFYCRKVTELGQPFNQKKLILADE